MPPFQFPSREGITEYPTTLGPYVGAVMFETFLYGIYLVLFISCIFILVHPHRLGIHWIMLIFACLMFCLATADIAYTYYLVFEKLLGPGLTFEQLYPKYMIFITNNFLADILLLYRCYVIWGRTKYIIAAPAILVLATAVCGYAFYGTFTSLFSNAWIYLCLTFMSNLLLTGLTAGRIGWLVQNLSGIVNSGLVRRCYIIMAIFIESGLTYCVYIVLDLALWNNTCGHTILDAGLVQIVGIMPTLIIVQIGLGHTAQQHDTDDLGRFESVALPISPVVFAPQHSRILSADSTTTIVAIPSKSRASEFKSRESKSSMAY